MKRRKSFPALGRVMRSDAVVMELALIIAEASPLAGIAYACTFLWCCVSQFVCPGEPLTSHPYVEGQAARSRSQRAGGATRS